jgi:hypothetical protein
MDDSWDSYDMRLSSEVGKMGDCESYDMRLSSGDGKKAGVWGPVYMLLTADVVPDKFE